MKRIAFLALALAALCARAGVTIQRPVEQTYSMPFIVETLPGAYMQYGAGDDRLGGSKIGFLASGIPLKVVGCKGDLYKVALSAHRTAYIPAEYTTESSQTVNTVITGSWAVTNEGTFDRVAVSLPARLPYRYYTQIDPSTLVIEIYGANDNSNWITQRTLDLGMVDYVTFDQPESDVYQVIIRLKHKYQWGFKVSYEGTRLLIDVRHTPADLSLRALTIGLDAGHGDEYPGAIAADGMKEKDVNLDIATRLQKLLEKAGARVVMTRTEDVSLEMVDRKQVWIDANVDLAISIHNNAGCKPQDSPGTSTYYKHLFDRPLAEAVLGRLLQTGLPMFGLVGNFNFSLNSPTEFPNTLVEGAFMSSEHEAALLADPDFRQKLAEKVFQGIQDYLAAVRKSLK